MFSIVNQTEKKYYMSVLKKNIKNEETTRTEENKKLKTIHRYLIKNQGSIL